MRVDGANRVTLLQLLSHPDTRYSPFLVETSLQDAV